MCAERTAESSFSFVSFALLCLLSLGARAFAGELHFTNSGDSVDKVLLLADERMQLMPAVAAWKWRNQAAIADPARERTVTAHAVELARAMGFEPGSVGALFEVQIRAARESQIRLHARWRRSGFDFPGPIPSLQHDLRPKLDRFTADFLRALYVAAPELARADFAARYASRIESLRAPGWSDSDRRALLAALQAVRRVPLGAARAPSHLERIRAAGLLRVGTTGDYAPFSLEQAGILSGADIDLASSLAKQLGVTPVFIRTTWRSLIDDLRADRFDLAVGGISVTPARRDAAAFSIPYSSGGKTILSRCADVERFRTLADVDRRGVRIIVNPGGTNEQYVRANLHHARIIVWPDNRTVFDEIRAHHADVMITDDVEVELQRRRHPDLCRAFSGTLTHSDKALLVPRGSDLLPAVNEWLVEAIETGKTARALERHLH